MNRSFLLLFFVICGLWAGDALAQTNPSSFWPEGKQAALSLSFDDGFPSQIDAGLPLFKKYNVAVTFYVVPDQVKKRLDGWREAVADGHEIGNHTLHHPCTGNFDWVAGNALESYTLDQMQAELTEANDLIKKLLNVDPVSFAYPCGETAVGRGSESRSYIPLVDRLFTSGRGWLSEATNNPLTCDMASLMGTKMDDTDFEQIRKILEEAKRQGRWVILAGHDIGQSGAYTTRIETLEKLISYAQDPKNGIWLRPVGTVSEYMLKHPDRKIGELHP